jgi:glycosyltransferase involved in cell wall biosynthesis
VEAIESALNQTYKEIEIIVVDDGSTDDTRTVLQHYCGRVMSVYQENRGRSAARNRGIELANGEYLAFLDSDDLYLPNKVSSQVALLEQWSDLSFIYANGYTMDTEGRLGALEPLFVEALAGRSNYDLAERLLKGSFFLLTTALVRRSALDHARFDESLEALEDWDFWLRLVLKGARYAYNDEKVVLYRRHDGNTDALIPGVHRRSVVSICSNVILDDLDRQLPTTLRQYFRVQHLGAVVRTCSPALIRMALGTVLRPERRVSVAGARALIAALLALAWRMATRAVARRIEQRQRSIPK